MANSGEKVVRLTWFYWKRRETCENVLHAATYATRRRLSSFTFSASSLRIEGTVLHHAAGYLYTSLSKFPAPGFDRFSSSSQTEVLASSGALSQQGAPKPTENVPLPSNCGLDLKP
ncbi:hypothetical protein F2P81_003174 [Scophthalmus maximus]|uniref:Uncharacterized protein n=1 Tax=Scophthalmus maximus TaxID=52904 RepID=A0A6A4T8Y2_SCOMX|nr:hypothetical protein F2P81_003174 [Scophthalmus maximus]